MHPVSCTNTHHDVTNLVKDRMVKNIQSRISRERNITFLSNKKIPNLCLRWHILRIYGFVAKVIFKQVVFVLGGNAYLSFNFEANIFTIVGWIYVERYRDKF